ncbi:hypothetical protein ACXWR7_12840, partial [Streptococcus pyogenes]
ATRGVPEDIHPPPSPAVHSAAFSPSSLPSPPPFSSSSPPFFPLLSSSLPSPPPSPLFSPFPFFFFPLFSLPFSFCFFFP